MIPIVERYLSRQVHDTIPEELARRTLESLRVTKGEICFDGKTYTPVSDLTIKQARDLIIPHATKGHPCLLCGRRLQIKAYALNGSQVAALAWMSARGKAWIHLGREAPAWINRTKSTSTMAAWGLVESGRHPPWERHDPEHPGAGWWRITDLGLEFLEGRLAIPERAIVYNEQVLGYLKPFVYVEDVVPKFQYRRLLAGDQDALEACLKRRKRKTGGAK